MRAADAIAAGPDSSDADDLIVQYLGVPKGYVAERPAAGPVGPKSGPPPAAQVAPRYTEADLYSPEAMSTEDKARLQQSMDRAGLFRGTDKYRLGNWDETSIGAYTRLLAFANRGGYDQQEALGAIGTLTPDQYDALYGKGAYARSSNKKVGDIAGAGTEEDVKAGVINQRLSEDDLRYLAKRTARKSLGRTLTDDELNTFSGAYTQMQNAALGREAAANAATQGGANVTYAGATSNEVFAEQQAQKLDPTAFEARRQVGALRAVGGMLGELGGA